MSENNFLELDNYKDNKDYIINKDKILKTKNDYYTDKNYDKVFV